MNGVILLDIAMIIIAIILLFIVPLHIERNHRATWHGKMKRAALRHCVRGNSGYGQSRYNVIGGTK